MMKQYEQVSADESCWSTNERNRKEYPLLCRVELHSTGDQRLDGMKGFVAGYYGDCWLIVITDNKLPSGDLAFVISRYCVKKSDNESIYFEV